ncbi:hypothetical protein BC938DRAFT_472493 [Jimgerdemannia flammicorona]|uniref:Uncharacterized protein n=1 Tax=Jimgerdemannia flammicorona TaxID=994334 RepID=A0A433Q5Z1_9FUNG|nr:hypothetical protein BC938DRAFT_472493 [Jimgerdemannia flammicorona]
MEADIICLQLTHWLGVVHSSPGSQMEMPSFGVIAPYADLSAKYSANISVTFVDGFQGQERDDRTQPETSGSSPTTTALMLPSCAQIFALGHR